MPKSAKKSKPVKRATAVKPKMMMTRAKASELYGLLDGLCGLLISDVRFTPENSKDARAVNKLMISTADALYKAAGVK